MSDQEKMTKIFEILMTMTDKKCLNSIGTTALNRRKDLTQKETFSWIVNDEVQILPEVQGRSRGIYGTKGKILKINKVRIRVDFGNGRIYNVPKTMLMKN